MGRSLLTVVVVLEMFRAEQQRRGLLPSTIQRRDYSLRMLVRVFGESVLHLERDDIVAFLDTRPCGARARYAWLSNLHAFYAWAVSEGLCEHDPTERIIRPRLRQNLPRPIDPQDLSMLVKLASPRMRAWLCLGGYAGLRCAEIAGLERDRVLDTGDRPMLHVIGKGRRERLVPMHPVVGMALHDYGLPRRGPVFRRVSDGEPFNPAQVSQIGGRFMRDHGVDASMHQLRHHFATYAYRGSHDIRAVQELLGHSSPTTTAVYTAWDPVSAAAAVASIPSPSWY